MEMARSPTTKSRRGPLDIEHCVAKNMTFASSLQSKYIKVFVSIIKSLNFVKNTEIELTENGLKYIVEESKSFQVKAYIMESFFSTFLFKPSKGVTNITFGVDLTSFTELLTAFIDNDLGNMNITYFHSENLIVFTCTQFDDESDDEEATEIKTEYFLKTLHSNEPIDFDSVGPVSSEIILDASFLLNMLNDFDRNIEEIAFKITPRKFQLKGENQNSFVAKLNSNNEVFDKFECKEQTRFVYKFSYFRVLVRALSLASKVSIRTLGDGLLRIQLKVRIDEEEQSAFIEYNMLPSIDEESEQEE